MDDLVRDKSTNCKCDDRNATRSLSRLLLWDPKVDKQKADDLQGSSGFNVSAN